MRTATPSPTMAPERRAILVELMARLPHDLGAEVGLLEAFGDEIRGTLVVLARTLGMGPIPPDELDGLAFDACGVLAVVARWWDPAGGALPWTYGRQRLLTLLRDWRGAPTVALPEGEVLGAAVPVVAPVDDLPAIEVLDRLVRGDAHPLLALLQEALNAQVGPADRELVLVYLQQLADGDPSPALTVAALVGRSPDAVRQAYCRARRKLRALALGEARFRPLLGLPLLADRRRTGRRAA